MQINGNNYGNYNFLVNYWNNEIKAAKDDATDGELDLTEAETALVDATQDLSTKTAKVS